MPTVNNKARYISVAVTTEGEQTRTIPGSPPAPIVVVQHVWVAGSSCEILMFQLTDDGNVPPTINIQGTTTTLTGPQDPDNSFTAAIDLDTNGFQYAMNFVLINPVPSNDYLWSIPVFSPNANGDVAPVRNIQGSATGFDAIKAQWLSGAIEPEFAGICLDGTSRIYAGISDTILRFDAGADGNATGTVFLQDTALFGQAQASEGITSLCFDPVRQWIWVTFLGGTSAGVSAYDLSGTRQRLIQGININMNDPTQVAISPIDGTIWVGDVTQSLQSFAPDADGNATPTNQIRYTIGNHTAVGIAVDASGNIYGSFVTDGGSQVVSYPPDATGTQSPTTDIAGDMTDLDLMIGDFFTSAQQIVVK